MYLVSQQSSLIEHLSSSIGTYTPHSPLVLSQRGVPKLVIVMVSDEKEVISSNIYFSTPF